MLDAAAPGLPSLAAEFAAPPDAFGWPDVALAPVPVPGHAAWDVALDHAALADLLPSSTAAPTTAVDPREVEAGLRQMDRYLARTWARAGIAPQQFDDCTQAVYAALLQQLGRDGFDATMADVAREGIPRVLNRDTARGPDFFRAVDMVKKRALRQRSHRALDDGLDLPGSDDGPLADWRGALQDAIARSLNAREADLIEATLQGFSPAEIAAQWGVAPKTVSNEKTRAFHKLREALWAEMAAD